MNRLSFIGVSRQRRVCLHLAPNPVCVFRKLPPNATLTPKTRSESEPGLCPDSEGLTDRLFSLRPKHESSLTSDPIRVLVSTLDQFVVSVRVRLLVSAGLCPGTWTTEVRSRPQSHWELWEEKSHASLDHNRWGFRFKIKAQNKSYVWTNCFRCIE